MDWQMSVFYFIFFTLDITSNRLTTQNVPIFPYITPKHCNLFPGHALHVSTPRGLGKGKCVITNKYI